jgi:dethiobiotin synthetase
LKPLSDPGTRGLFITGTDTSVGKTYVTCLIARAAAAHGLRAGVYKPACSGATRDPSGKWAWEDVERLADVTGRAVPGERICPQRYLAAVAPPLAARREGGRVDPNLLRSGAAWWLGRVDLLLVEGAGGLCSPIAEDELVLDLAADLGYPLLIVAADRLGTINHTLLTVQAARARGMPLAGIVLNQLTPAGDDSTGTNREDIERFCGIPVLGMLPWGGEDLLLPSGRPARMNWADLAGLPPARDDDP